MMINFSWDNESKDEVVCCLHRVNSLKSLISVKTMRRVPKKQLAVKPVFMRNLTNVRDLRIS